VVVGQHPVHVDEELHQGFAAAAIWNRPWVASECAVFGGSIRSPGPSWVDAPLVDVDPAVARRGSEVTTPGLRRSASALVSSMLVRRRFGQREDGREFIEVHRGLRGGGVFLPSEALPYDNGQQKPGGRPGWDVSVVGGIGLWHPNQREARQGDVRRVFGEPSHPAVQAGHVVTAYPDQHRIRLGLN